MSDKDYYSSFELDSNLDLDLDSDLNLNIKIEEINKKIEELSIKVDRILNILKKDVSVNTKKMSDHINFVENVYENVKYPLGFICNTVTHYMGSTRYIINNKIDYFKKLK
jgi:uncharacterized protein YfbU (UPF0304 family)